MLGIQNILTIRLYLKLAQHPRPTLITSIALVACVTGKCYISVLQIFFIINEMLSINADINSEPANCKCTDKPKYSREQLYWPVRKDTIQAEHVHFLPSLLIDFRS